MSKYCFRYGFTEFPQNVIKISSHRLGKIPETINYSGFHSRERLDISTEIIFMKINSKDNMEK
jgi:hypothetical protein